MNEPRVLFLPPGPGYGKSSLHKAYACVVVLPQQGLRRTPFTQASLTLSAISGSYSGYGSQG